MSRERAIAVIDSGVGGLTVAKEVMRQLPEERIVYVGDNARCPYGSKSPEEIRTYSFQMIDFVMNTPLKALVIACNTATAVVLEEARAYLPLPVIGVIDPGARAAVKVTKSGHIGVIGTETTIRTKAYERALLRVQPDLTVSGMACPAFVPLVENHMADSDEARRVVKETLAPLVGQELDTLILGCTHYPLLAPIIQDVMGDQVTLISSAEETARELSLQIAAIEEQPRIRPSTGVPQHLFVTSGETNRFRSIAEEWLDCQVHVEQHTMEKSFQS
ncbi:glutamate racemase [Brevibacillus choshinensis]|uniref:glutamate racemase n=1 Tax=Brevibacillus choshinensis TaxID=54911 RepID=UPI002E1AE412|nr:glutamate racemase [Brevibacillus choshinensis]MED4585466.1 glutamate racemase [Brevibacillus choshinensis]